jgi:ureidoglycolate lyase
MSTSGLEVLLAGVPLVVEPLTAEAFKAFGDVMEASDNAHNFTINQGFAQRFHRLAQIDVTQDGGQPALSIFRAKARPLPLHLSLLEKHPFGSQAFMPLSGHAYLVVVALGGDTPDMSTLKCFSATAQQGVNYAKGTWHHPLLALHNGDFLVVDRSAPAGEINCVEYAIEHLQISIDLCKDNVKL